MKIKVDEGLYVDSKTLFRLEWRKYIPVLVLSEKYEKKVKWILRIIAFIGIASSLISIDKWYYSLGLSLLIFIVEQFLENIIFEYTTFVVQPFPDFEIEAGQWKANAFMMTQEKNAEYPPYIGPAYLDKDYAIKFFTYIRSWGVEQEECEEDKIVLSFVIEDDGKYTTYIYANPARKNIQRQFDFIGVISALEKYKKNHQKLIVQMIYWNTLPINDGYSIKVFLDKYKPGEKFYLTPFVIDNNDKVKEPLTDLAILKTSYKLRKRAELTKFDIENNHFK